MAQNVAKGNIALTVDEAELEASLAFTPDQAGAEWTADKLLRLAMDSRIGGLTQKRADEIVGKFARSKARVVEPLAKGQAPEQPVPESVGWAELPLPADLQALAAELIAGAGPPEVYKVLVETITREKTVSKPAALPFLPPKVEKVKVQEKRERKERVQADPAVVRTGYAAKDSVLGEIYAAKPGKPGKNIYARPVPSDPDPGPFLLGRGIQRAKSSLVALQDGILRAGERWAEIIPLARHRWEVEPSGDGASLFLSYQPGHPSLPAPGAAEILQACLDKGAAAESLVPAESLAEALAAAARSGEALFSYCLSRDRDASVEALVSPDGLRATLSLRKARGHGRPLDLGQLGPALKAAGIKGFNPEKVKKDVLDFVKGPAAELLEYVLLEGKAPGRGKDRELSLSASFLAPEAAAAIRARLQAHPLLPKLLPSSVALPLDEGCLLAPVVSGQRVGELSPTSPGSAGRDVFGNLLPGLPGNHPAIRVHEGLSQGRDALVASAGGLLASQEKDGIRHLRVIPFRDCGIEAGVAPDGMSAWLSLTAELGLGQPLSVEGALAALQALGLTQGVDAAELGRAVARARAGEAVLRQVVARGRPPLPAGGRRIVWLAGGTEDESPPPKATLAAGSPVLRVEGGAGGAGREGLDLFGKPVPAPAAAPTGVAPPIHDESIREEAGAGGAVTWVAAGAGELLVEGNRVVVRQRLSLAGDVDQASGNQEFAGSIGIQGSVREGFRVVAGGDVAVGGYVEAALVSSGGSVLVRSGIKGARRGTVRAKLRIDAAFAEHAIIMAVEDVRMKSSCLSCNVKTNGRLLLGEPGGVLVGGLVRARKGIEVDSLGAENGMKTEVSFGQDYLVRDLIEAEEREIERLKALIVRADREMASLEGAGAGLDRLRQDKVKLLKLLEKRSFRVFDFREKYEEHFPSEVRVRGTAYPGVILESHNRFFEIRSRKSRVAFSFDPHAGRIVERPLQ